MSRQNEFEYWYDKTLKGYVVSKVVGRLADPHVVIPETYEGEPVVAIGSSCFSSEDAKKVVSITIPASVKRIGTGAFYYCTILETVVIPEDSSLGSIEARAFGYCEQLKNIFLPDGVRAVGDGAFFHCDSLEKIYLGSCLITMGDMAFSQCKALTEVTFAADCELPYVTSRAFSHCKNLRSVELSRDIDTIQWEAFAYCDNLERVSFPEGSELEEIDRDAFLGCDNLKELSFENCPKLKRIGKNAFYHSDLLADVKFHPDSNVKLEDGALPKKEAPAKKGGCYVATCVYGSYDCPPVWTLRRFRDEKLARSFWGRSFIQCYYAVSPMVVRLIGDTKLFVHMVKPLLDSMVNKLHEKGYADTPYQD